MKNRFPWIIDAVRIDQLDLGVNAFRVISLKQLDPNEPISEKHEPEHDSSRHVNMEIKFEYRGQDRKPASVSGLIYKHGQQTYLLLWKG